jgi:hypothetical protein
MSAAAKQAEREAKRAELADQRRAARRLLRGTGARLNAPPRRHGRPRGRR